MKISLDCYLGLWHTTPEIKDLLVHMYFRNDLGLCLLEPNR